MDIKELCELGLKQLSSDMFELRKDLEWDRNQEKWCRENDDTDEWANKYAEQIIKKNEKYRKMEQDYDDALKIIWNNK